ncbi:uncharacterized protein LACBIDRAFT_332483 [Laccaria bicolor S238N-H82]|uniref:Predicted protein n=1 Tax=Laccaria bicolor (strain S238N-H82 / ATCC MYA-4686) TaxID=486041 RepID=B0DSW0_LACBS|nr:uncharacterized protein LACBIDRAFT_332483 [Laccaria bicolor S238N-H82]EDR02312.1 predicted protein [Laccaria bicolor S238N-H82]|eukprot:XP_001886989.1 predicted protein [Laccaria bicolor S238N-H82]
MSTLSMASHACHSFSTLIVGEYNLQEDLPTLTGFCKCSDVLGALVARTWFVVSQSLSSDNNPPNMRNMGSPTLGFGSSRVANTSANRISTPQGCKVHPLGRLFLGWFYLIMATECVRHSPSDWISQLYKNVLSAINIIFIAIDVIVSSHSIDESKPTEYKHMFAFPARVLNSIFGNRVMLLLVEHRHRTLQNNMRYRSRNRLSTDIGTFLTTVGHDIEVTGKDEADKPWMSEGEWIT